jgi:hypothetical protein
MQQYTLEFSGTLLKEAYSLYVIKLTHPDEGELYYVGQTGNRAIPVARAIFRRLSGHFDDQGRSTQNQIYRSIAIRLFNEDLKTKDKAFTEEVKQAVSAFFGQCAIKVQAFPIFEFDFGISPEEHKRCRRSTEAMEQGLIAALSDKELLNIKSLNAKPDLTEKEQEKIKEIKSCLS